MPLNSRLQWGSGPYTKFVSPNRCGLEERELFVGTSLLVHVLRHFILTPPPSPPALCSSIFYLISPLTARNSRFNGGADDAMASLGRFSLLLLVLFRIFSASALDCYSLSGTVMRGVIPCNASISGAENSHSACCNADFYDACF